MINCSHQRVYFERGRLNCVECGADITPLPNVRVVMVFDNYREKMMNEIGRIVNGLPEDVLADIEKYADYLKWKRN